MAAIPFANAAAVCPFCGARWLATPRRDRRVRAEHDKHGNLIGYKSTPRVRGKVNGRIPTRRQRPTFTCCARSDRRA